MYPVAPASARWYVGRGGLGSGSGMLANSSFGQIAYHVLNAAQIRMVHSTRKPLVVYKNSTKSRKSTVNNVVYLFYVFRCNAKMAETGIWASIGWQWQWNVRKWLQEDGLVWADRVDMLE